MKTACQVFVVFSVILLSSCKKELTYPTIEDYDYHKVWSEAPHNAFTDLTYFKGEFYLVFREGAEHASDDGIIRILKSKDGINYVSEHTIEESGFDLRDPKFVNVKDSALIIYYAITKRDEFKHADGYQSSLNGTDWVYPKRLATTQGDWMWNVIYYKNMYYGVSYDFYKNNYNKLYVSDYIGTLRPRSVLNTGQPNSGENSLVILNDTVYSAIRQKHFSLSSYVGKAHINDLSKWSYTPQHPNDIVGGPKLFVLPDKNLYLVTRSIISDLAVTAFYRVNKSDLTLKHLFSLPSRGDNGYAGVVVKAGNVFVSYYSTFINKSEIFVAKIPVTYFYNH